MSKIIKIVPNQLIAVPTATKIITKAQKELWVLKAAVKAGDCFCAE